jgi:hypothetical protein
MRIFVGAWPRAEPTTKNTSRTNKVRFICASRYHFVIAVWREKPNPPRFLHRAGLGRGCGLGRGVGVTLGGVGVGVAVEMSSQVSLKDPLLS